MRISLRIALATAMVACCTVVFGNAVACGLGDSIDLSGFAEIRPEDEVLPIEDVSLRAEKAARRFYISGIIGDSYETASGSGDASSASVFTAGGAAGVSFDRPSGALRLEFEGRGRGDWTVFRVIGPTSSIDSRITDNWSTLLNAWRDVAITEGLGVYAGGGIGAGGFDRSLQLEAEGFPTLSGSQAVTTFAWQAGGGVIYQLTNRVTLDFGYRFYQLQPCQKATFIEPPITVILSSATLSASEFLLSVRIYEPFRGWR